MIHTITSTTPKFDFIETNPPQFGGVIALMNLMPSYVQLGKIKFIRAITPPNFNDEPLAITYSDGSESAYGAVMYLRWNTDQGPVTKLVESKDKLTPIDHRGDAVKAEMCGAVFASRLRKYFEQHSQIRVGKWYHLVDS